MEAEKKQYGSPFYRLFRESCLATVIMDLRGGILISNDQFNHIYNSLDIPRPSRFSDGRPASMREFLDLEGSGKFTDFFSPLISGASPDMVFETPSFRESGRSGLTRWFKVHAWIMKKVESAAPDIQGPFIGLTVEDQTSVRERERKLLENREIAEKAMEAKSQFLANMSHEIRTPIQTVIGMTELLRDTKLDYEQSEYSRQIKFSAEVLLSLINDILDFSKIEAGKMELECADLDLEQTIEQAVEMISLEAHKKGLEIDMDIPPDADIIIKGDANKLRQIVINLVKNAVKFTKEGAVTITVRLTEIAPKKTGDAPQGPPLEAVRVSVADTGIGISEENRKRLFTTFMQADASTTRRFGGTGLGLAISRSLVELMHGYIEMVPNEGHGSVFRFTFPIERSGLKAEPLEAVSGSRDLRILVVDDRSESLYILASYLKDIGYIDIETAVSGEIALTMMKAAASRGRPYELCFIDSIMPVMDGWRLAAAIHNTESINGAGLILMAPHGMLGPDTKMTLLKWFKAYINKPIRRRNLAETIRMAFAEPVDELEAVADAEAAPEGSAAAPVPSPAVNKPLILIVEDHPVNQKLFSIFMDKLGFPSVLADDGLDALEKAAANPVALVFMDIQMPRMNGYEAAEHLRGQGFVRPVIAVTASALSDEKERCMSVGFDDILVKPFKKPDIQAMLNKWITVRQEGPAYVAPEPAVPGAVSGGPSRTAASVRPEPVTPEPAALPAGTPAGVPAGALEIFDAADLMETFMDNAELAKSLLGGFVERTGKQIAAIPGLVKSGDWEAARREAHTIKGSALTMGGRELGRTAGRLELACKNRDTGETDAACTPVAEAFARFKEAVTAYLKKP
jgi:signal transduction histidine kinase/CheY-like chemotaxis protein/HPt (histidine-containing phosphotransfer) domain-containing protein